MKATPPHALSVEKFSFSSTSCRMHSAETRTRARTARGDVPSPVEIAFTEVVKVGCFHAAMFGMPRRRPSIKPLNGYVCPGINIQLQKRTWPRWGNGCVIIFFAILARLAYQWGWPGH